MRSKEASITLLVGQTTAKSQAFSHTVNRGANTHYDCLGFVLTRKGKKILPNLATIDDGATLHYGDYKNPVIHNTLVLDQKNQPPINPNVLGYEETDRYTVIDSVLDWSKPPANIEAHPLVSLDEKLYRDVQFRRVMIWLGDAAIELNQIANPNSQPLDLIYHARGNRELDDKWMYIDNHLDGPLALLRDTQVVYTHNCEVVRYHIQGQADYRQHIWVNKPSSILSGSAPHNPNVSALGYLLVRNHSTEFRTAVLHDLSDEQGYALTDVNWDSESVRFVLCVGDQYLNAVYDFATAKFELDQRFLLPTQKIDAERLLGVWGKETLAEVFF